MRSWKSERVVAEAKRRGFMLALSSPSGAGKTTLSRRLMAQDEALRFSVSVTTRPKRPVEQDGKDYHFVDADQFEAMSQAGELLEHANVFGHQYGTPAKAVEQHLAAGHDVLFEIDWQGYRQLKEKCPQDVVGVFILPPSMPELQRRLTQRGQDEAQVMQQRMQQATSEISHWQEYEYVLMNTDLDVALENLGHIIEAERLRRERQLALPAFIQTLL